MNLSCEAVSYSIGERELLREIDCRIDSGEFVGLIGPNGSGKSTLLKNVYRRFKLDQGVIRLDERDVRSLSRRRMAQLMSVLRQETMVEFDFTVEEMVRMGRHPHKGWWEAETDSDRDIAANALERVGMADFRGRSFLSLSGGEKQRVLIARALAQEAQVLILDEPTNHLDVRYQLQLMDLLEQLDITIFAALHDLNIAATYCHRLYAICNGKIAASGPPEQLLQPNLLRQIFGVDTEVIRHPRTGRPHILFFSEKQRKKERDTP
ncbi:ABC transporter ATP-binding protein [Paludifilum halophilum]|uniref:ABC transporter n=1 Tax=Paludifilum halophilum TaxID=1642702 RepID=A0A235B481_9BACL|nr:ABC transporter ATP-binding protein [Paludifilum halophilum]OYD07110.1 ABC transporter [Paludifilum halophilum]